MAIITTREVGATAKGTTLSNAEIDNNFINLNTDIATRIPASEKGVVNGVATLDDAGKVPATQLPSYVDDVQEAANLAAFPATGETGKIYVALDTNKTYRWSGSVYVYITSGAVDSVAGKTGVVTLNNSDVGLANVDNTSDANKPVSTATQTALNTKQAALGYTPVNKAGDTITGDLLNSAAYSAPNNASGAGTKVLISGSTGTGAAGAAGGNGYIEVLGSGATSSFAWTDFTGDSARRRGGVHIKSGTAQADVADTYRHGSYIDIIASNGTNSQTLIGDGGRVLVRSGGGGGYGGIPNNGASITLLGATSTSSGRVVLASGSYSGASFTSNPGSSIDISAATAEASSSIRLYIGQAGGGSNVPGSVSGKAYVNRGTDYEILDAGNYSSYAQPLLVSGTTIKTINGTSVLGSGDIVISALPLTGGTLTGTIIIGGSVAAPADSTATALSYGRLQGYGHIHINADTDQSTTEFVYITAGYATANSSSANGLAVGNTTLTWKDNAVLHAGNYNSYALPLSGGTITGTLFINSGTGAADYNDLWLGGAGGWATNESHGINAYYGSLASPSIFTRVDSLFDGTKAIMRWKNFYFGQAPQTSTVMTLTATSATSAALDVTGAITQAGNQVLHAGNYTNYKPPLLAPINVTSTSVSNWNPQGLTYQAWGQAFVHSSISADSGDVTWWLRPSEYVAGGTELCMIIDGDYYAGTGAHKVLHAGNYNSYSPTLTGGGASGTWGISVTGSAGSISTAGGYTLTGNSTEGVSSSWIGFPNGQGIWSTVNNAHLLPNNTGSYGSWYMYGSRNGWFGLHFGSGSTLMMNSTEVGFHREGYGWQMRWSAGVGYVHKDVAGGGTEATILDSSNYNSYSPTLTGGNASGTWGISITGNAATATNASQLNGLSKVQLWNNSGQGHSTYQSFGAVPNFGMWFMQNSVAADSPQTGSQYYVQTEGLGNDYAYGTYGLMTAVARDHVVKYTYYRTQEGGSWGAWVKAAAGYADTAGSSTSASYAIAINVPSQQTEYIILDGPANGPVIKVRYDGGTANRYIDIGTKDGNGVYTTGLKIWNGDTPTWSGNTILHAGNYNSYAPTLTGGGASGTWGISITGSASTASSLPTAYAGGIQSNPQVYFNENIGLKVAMTGVPFAWCDTLWINGYSGADVPNMLAIHTARNGQARMWISTQSNRGSSYGTQYEIPSYGLNYDSGDLYAKVYYDSQDTSYYVDPNSGSRLAHIFAGNVASSNDGGWNARMNLVGSSHARLDVVSNSDGIITTMSSHTGQGVGKVGTYSSHPLVLVAQGAVEGGSVYNGSLRSPIFYDSDNTAYYIDPNSTSDSALRMRGGALFGPNTSWNASLYVGGNGRVGTSATVAVTNGNLHIDAQDGYSLYLNWYNTANIYTQSNLGVGTSSADYRLHVHGTGLATSDFRAPIFYDSNDTSYYVDPNSSSRLVNLGLGGVTPDVRLSVSGDGHFSGVIYLGGTAGSYNSWGSRDYTTSGLRYFNAQRYQFNNFGYGSTYTIDIDASGNLIASNSVRAPIFYDSDDTGYYTDPASESNLLALKVRGNPVSTYNQTQSDFTAGTLVLTNIVSSGFAGDSFRLEVKGKSYGSGLPYSFLAEGYIYSDTIINVTGIHLGFNAFSTIKVFNYNGVLGFWWPRAGYWHSFEIKVIATSNVQGNQNRVTNVYDSAEPTDSFVTKKVNITMAYYMRGDTGATNASSLSAPIFYDSNDTSYYVDPNSTSYQRNLFLGAHDSGASEFRFGEDSSGWYGDRWYWDSSFTLYRYSRHAGTDSLIHYHDTRDASRITYGRNIVFDDYGKGIVGLYDSTRYQGVFAMGDSYKLPANGTTTGNLYGIAWSHPNAGGVAGNLNTHGALILENGTFLAALSGSIRSRDDMRTQIFYDSNDTSYYVDPNSQTRLWYTSVNVGQETTGGANSSNAGLVLRGNYNSNTWAHKFHKFDNGTGVPLYLSTTVGTDVWSPRQAWGSGLTYDSQVFGSFAATSAVHSPIFYDSNNTGYYLDPNSLSNLYDLQLTGSKHTYLYLNPGNDHEAMVRYNGGSGNTWYVGKRITSQLVGTESFHFYSQAAGATVGGVDTGGNMFASGSHRAPIFYDNNDTAYYADPNSTSNFVGLTVANQISGSVSGTANGLSSSNYINRTGSSGSLDTDFSNTPAGTQRYQGDDASISNSPGGTWWIYEHKRHSNASSVWGTQVAWGWEDNANRLAQRNVSGSSWSGWVYYLNSANYNSYSPTLTGGGASGTWGISISGNAATITGQANSATITASTGVTGSHIVQRDGNGYIYANHINFNTSETENATINSFITSNGDGWSRKSSPAHVISQLGLLTTSNYNSYAFKAEGTFSGDIDADRGQGVFTLDPTPSGTPPIASPNIRTLNIGSNFARRTQLAFPYESDRAFFRRRNDGGWNGWREFIHDYNYNSYSPTLTGGGASGTWGISISGSSASTTGNAATVSHYASRTDGFAYPVGWFSGSNSQAYSCAAVTITSSSGQLSASILYSSGNVTAYSDERVKTNWREYTSSFVDLLANIKHGTYDRVDCELTQDGVSAQSLQKLLPYSVITNAEDKLSVNYGSAAMVSAIELAKRVVEQDLRIAKLEALVAQLLAK
jgi:hypothetical protein